MWSKDTILKSKNILNDLPYGVIATDKDANIFFVNNEFEKLTGYNEKDVLNKKIGKNTGILYSGFHPDEFYKKMWGAILSGEVYSELVLNKNKQGEDFWQRVTIKRHSYNGDSTFMAYLQNATKDVDKAIMLSKMLELVPAVIYIYDLVSGKNIFVNESIHDLGYTRKDIEQLDDTLFLELLHPEDLRTAIEANNKIRNLKNGGNIEVLFRMKSKIDGEYYWYQSIEAVFKRNTNNIPIQKIGIAIKVDSIIEMQTNVGKIEKALNSIHLTQRKMLRN